MLGVRARPSADGSFGETEMAQSYIHEMYGSSRASAIKVSANSNTYQEGQMRAPRFSPSGTRAHL
jgi:hypothetical protein